MNSSLSLRIVCLLFGCAVSSGVLAQTAFTLKEAQEYAVKTNVNALNAKLDVDMAVARKNEIRAIGLPQLNASVDIKDYVKLPVAFFPDFIGPAIYQSLLAYQVLPPGTPAPPSRDPSAVALGTKYNITAGATLSQLLFSNDYLVGLQASKAYLDLSQKMLDRSAIETRVVVAKAYYSVLINRERIKLLDANIERLEKLRSDIVAMGAAGFVERIDQNRVEVSLNNLKTEKEKIGRLMLLAEYLLKFQMGYPADQSITLTDQITLDQLPSPDVLDNSKANASNRIEYKLLESQVKLNALDLKRNRGGYLPSLAAYSSGSYSFQKNNLDLGGFRWIPVLIVGATLNVPIFDGFSKHFKIQQAVITLQKSKNQQAQFEQAVQLEVAQAQASYNNALSSIKTQQRNAELAREVYDVTKTKYQQGVGTNTDVVNADAALKESQTNLYNSLYDFYLAKIDLDKALGTFTK
jgi:outer membrane protein TolC